MRVIPFIAIAASLMLGAAQSAADDTVEGFGPVLKSDALQSMRIGEGGFDPAVLVEVDNDGSVGGNVAQGNLSGQNSISGGAFSNAAGISTVIQNSGNNVLIQNGTAVNVQFGGNGP
jgi:hypothetical protein